MPIAPDEARPARGARLLVACTDRPGIVAAVSGFLFERGANILSSDQHSTEPSSGGMFFMRMHFATEGIGRQVAELAREFDREVATPFAMDWRIRDLRDRPRMVVLASREDHCLLDLLWRWRRGDLDCEITAVISNHDVGRRDVEALGVPFHHVPVDPEAKPEAEREILAAIGRAGADLVVLARYMQILSAAFLREAGAPIINIHHSFLPAFVGADPYARAAERGVKIIGATAHYVTEELDAGPIIEQDVARVSHADDVAAMTRTGADIERLVLARAVQRHLEDRVLVHAGKTVVF